MFETKLKKRARVEIIPMIDVIFFLLVFFMLFTTFRSTPHGLDITIPRASTATAQEDAVISIDISKDGNYFVDGQTIDLNFELRDLIAPALERAPHLVVILKADQNTAYKNVVEVMNILREEGVFRIAFGAEPLRGD